MKLLKQMRASLDPLVNKKTHEKEIQLKENLMIKIKKLKELI